MREIKFDYIYGVDGEESTYFHKQFTLADIESGEVYAVLHDEPLMKDYSVVGVRMFTGLKDRNGVEIYEGDIIEFDRREWGGDDNIHMVSWDEKEGAWCWGGGSSSDMEYREVIGNIYENPELLNQPTESNE